MTERAAPDADVRALLAGAGECRVFPEQLEGPYHREVHPDRRDLVEDRVGVTLRLGIRLLDGDHEPLRGVAVEVWGADWEGRYSGFRPIQAAPGEVVTSASVPRDVVAPRESFLRGLQHADDDGSCQFDMLYPGWYPSRTVHVHLIAHLPAGRHATTQLYFPEPLTDLVFARAPYAARPARDTTNATDSIYADGGADSVLTAVEDGDGVIGALTLLLPA